MEPMRAMAMRCMVLVTAMIAGAPAFAQELVDEGTWRGPDGAPPMIMVLLVAAATVAAAVVILYSLTVGRTPRHEDTRPA